VLQENDSSLERILFNAVLSKERVGIISLSIWLRSIDVDSANHFSLGCIPFPSAFGGRNSQKSQPTLLPVIETKDYWNVVAANIIFAIFSTKIRSFKLWKMPKLLNFGFPEG